MLLAALIIIFQNDPLLSAEQDGDMQTVAVLPFEVSRDGKYGYLHKAISQMLVTRLSQKEGIQVLTPQLDQQAYQALEAALQSGNYAQAAADLRADWLVDGSIYSLQDGLQLNLDLYPAAGGQPLSFSMKSAGEEDILGSVTSLASDLYTRIAQPAAVDAGQVGAQTAAEKASSEEGMSGFATPHPERAYKKGLYGGAALLSGTDGEARFESRGVRKSGTIELQVESLVSGDLDGDGTSELVVASKSKIRVFSYDDLNFKVVAEYDFSPRMKIHMLNVGDPGNTGTMKLFVSGNEGRWASSSILSWNGSKSLQSIRQGLRWYIRPVTLAGNKEVLIGQEASYRSEENFLSPGVFELSIDPKNGQLVRGAKLLLPENTNLFDFIQADLDGDGGTETIVIDARQKLLVYDSALNLIWVSGANYGGSKKYFGPDWGPSGNNNNGVTGLSEAEQSNRILVFIPGRLDTKDITGDGLPEVVVSTNEVGVSKYLYNTRYYNGGSVACLGWYGQGLSELWQTSHITGYVADYFFDDSPDPAEAEEGRVLNRLYVAQIPEVSLWEQLLPTSATSKILAYEMLVQRGGADAARQ